MRVQLQQLRYFVSVAESGHFTRSAEALGVSQPTLSKQIHTLEATLGAPLFDRSRGGVMLTTAGETLRSIRIGAPGPVTDSGTLEKMIGASGITPEAALESKPELANSWA